MLSNVSALSPRGFCLSVMDKVCDPVLSLVPSTSWEVLVQFMLTEHLGKAFLKSAKYLLGFA